MKKEELDKISRAVRHHEDMRQGDLFRAEKKKKKRICNDERLTTLVVPNRTTYMKVGEELDKEKIKDPKHPEIPKDAKFLSAFTPVQLKVIIFLVKEIQNFIRPQLEDVRNYAKNKTEKNRLMLMNKHESRIEEFHGRYFCEIPKKLFVSGRNYARLEREIHSLAWIPVQFKTRHPKNNRMVLKSTTLFSIYEYLEPDKEKQRTVSIEIQKDVLMLLSSINVAPKNVLWDCDYYNKIGYEVILNSKKKYTGLLYFYLCPWREKEGWRVETNELKALLGINEGQYLYNSKFQRDVLKPAATELREIGDFWFEAVFKGDYTVFKIISPEKLKKKNEAVSSFIRQLKSIHIDEVRIKTLNNIILNSQYHNKARSIISNCMNEYYKKGKSENPISYLPDYIYAAIKRLNDSLPR